MIQLPTLIDSTLALFMAVHRLSAQRASSRSLILMAGVRNDAENNRFRHIVKSCHIGSGIAAWQHVVSDILTLLLRELGRPPMRPLRIHQSPRSGGAIDMQEIIQEMVKGAISEKFDA